MAKSRHCEALETIFGLTSNTLHPKFKPTRTLQMFDYKPIEILRIRVEEAEQALAEKCGFPLPRGKFWSESDRMEALNLIEKSKAAITSSKEALGRYYGDYFQHTAKRDWLS